MGGFTFRASLTLPLLLVAFPSAIKGAIDPCIPNPCGANTQCTVIGGRPVCSCLPGYWGEPTTYCQRGECSDSSYCPSTHTCRDYRCVDVCAGQCGINAECHARNHIPTCSCPPQYSGDPLTSCRLVDPQALCHPTPCGANTQCHVKDGVPTCTCLPGYFGAPLQGCRHECESDYECASSQSCQNYRCVALCTPGTCAPTANCEARNHRSVCTCPPGYFGDPAISCNAECLVHQDCPSDRPSCQGSKCVDPCAGACGIGADCRVRNHVVAVCSCPKDMTGNPFVRCRPFEKTDLCDPNPCGRNAKCQPGYDRSGKERPVCTCLPGFLGDPLRYCHPGECTSDSDCRHDQNCLNNDCKPSCTDQCGINAICNARNHVAVCSCPPGYTGDALSRCSPQPTARSLSSSRYSYYR